MVCRISRRYHVERDVTTNEYLGARSVSYNAKGYFRIWNRQAGSEALYLYSTKNTETTESPTSAFQRLEGKGSGGCSG